MVAAKTGKNAVLSRLHGYASFQPPTPLYDNARHVCASRPSKAIRRFITAITLSYGGKSILVKKQAIGILTSATKKRLAESFCKKPREFIF
jgi:hypothetical protein